MNRLKLSCPIVLLLTLATSTRADTLELKSGKSVQGQYLGGTGTTVVFKAGDSTQTFATSDAKSLTFAQQPASTPSAPASQFTPAATPAGMVGTIPAGTVLLVRMIDGVSSKDPQGKRFTTTLESDLTVAGQVVLRAGTKVYGRVQSSKQAGRFAGQSTVDLRLAEIAAGGALVPISTGPYAQAGSRSGGKTARGAAGGAAIGAIVDGGDGAAKGAAIGAIASGLRRGETVAVNPGTLLEFQLQQPVSINL